MLVTMTSMTPQEMQNYKVRDLYSGSAYTGYCGFNIPS